MAKKKFVLTTLFGIAVAIVLFRFLNTLAHYSPILEYIYISPFMAFIMLAFMLIFIIYLMYDNLKNH